MTHPSIVTVARIGAAHGVRGDLKLQIFSEADLSAFSCWYIQYPKQSWEAAPTFEITFKGSLSLIQFEGCRDRDECRRYTNALIGVDRRELPALGDGEYYWHDLEGLTVVNHHNEQLGVVDHLFETGANDVIVVKGDMEHLIPYIPDVVTLVDLDAGILQVDWEKDY